MYKYNQAKDKKIKNQVKNDWLTNELKEEIIYLFQPLYKRTLTGTEITDIANTLANTAELWIKFNWRIEHGR